MSMIEKYLKGKTGECVAVTPDFLVMNDGFGYKVADLVPSGQLKHSDKGVIVIDHDVPAGNSDSSQIFQNLVKFSKERGIKFIQAEGVTYLALINSFVKKGDIILSCSNHNSIYGAVGALGLKVTEEELAQLFSEDTFDYLIPETVSINLEGKLNSSVSAIDLFISFLGEIEVDILKGRVIEFTGEGLGNLALHDRMVLCSMATRTGAITALINEESSETGNITFDLSQVEPVIALPVATAEAPFIYSTVDDLANKSFEVGFIGGYTGGYIEDLIEAAELARGNRIALGFRLNICPVSSSVYLEALSRGLITDLIDFGAQILAPSDRNVVLQGAGVAGSKERVLTTGSYNFAGCLGSDDAEVFIGSVKNVMTAAMNKQI
jgi:3-isopropylmalate/(R)-2-methylmalate dehydratase large subunit